MSISGGRTEIGHRSTVTRSRITHRSQGVFSFRAWLQEGDGLFASARITRATWLLKLREFKRKLKVSNRPPTAAKTWTELEGLPRASVLLLGYAVEMYLKAGVARVYHQCPEDLLHRDLRSRFKHDLVALAKEVDFALTPDAARRLEELGDFILDGARYPITPKPGASYTSLWNARTGTIWDKAVFRTYCSLVEDIRRHVGRLDQDSSNPATFQGFNIDQDGYLVFRLGGNLRVRITYRASTELRLAGQTSPADIKKLLSPKRHMVILHYWDQATIVEDGQVNGKSRTIVHA